MPSCRPSQQGEYIQWRHSNAEVHPARLLPDLVSLLHVHHTLTARRVTASLYLHWRGLAEHFRFGIRVATSIRNDIIEPSIAHALPRSLERTRGLRKYTTPQARLRGLRGQRMQGVRQKGLS